MTITVAPSRNEYTGSAGQTIFNYTFKIFESTDLNVYVTPAGQECSDSDLTTAYTVSGIGDPAGGSITLNTPTSDGDLVTIVSAIPSERTTDYQNNGDFRPDTVNEDFDRVVSIVKKLESKIHRAPLLSDCVQGPYRFGLEKPKGGYSILWDDETKTYKNFLPSSSFPSIPESRNIGLITNYLFKTISDAKKGLTVGGFLVSFDVGNVITILGDQQINDSISFDLNVLPSSEITENGIDTFIDDSGQFAFVRNYNSTVNVIKTNEDLKKTKVPLGCKVLTLGDQVVNDNSGNLFTIESTQKTTRDIELDSGFFATPQTIEIQTARRFRGTMEDDQGSPDAVFAVERSQGGENSPHSFRDNSDWFPEGVGEPAFASFDADADIYDEVVTDHFIDFQARGRKFGSGIMRTMWGFASINRVDAGHVNKATAFDNKFRISPEATCTTYTSFQSEPAVYGDTGTITHFQVRAGFTLPETSVGSETGLFIKAMQFAPVGTTRPILIEPQREGVKNLISCETEFTRDQEVTNKDYGFVIRSPDNSRWRITVDNSGNLSATAL